MESRFVNPSEEEVEEEEEEEEEGVRTSRYNKNPVASV